MHPVNEFVQTWWPVAAFLLSLGGVFLSLWVNSQIDKKCGALNVDEKVEQAKATLDAKIAEASAAIDSKTDQIRAAFSGMVTLHGDRLTKLEAQWETLPTRDDFHRIAVQCERMGGELSAVKARLDGMADTMKASTRALERVNDYLLDQKQ